MQSSGITWKRSNIARKYRRRRGSKEREILLRFCTSANYISLIRVTSPAQLLQTLNNEEKRSLNSFPPLVFSSPLATCKSSVYFVKHLYSWNCSLFLHPSSSHTYTRALLSNGCRDDSFVQSRSIDRILASVMMYVFV